jgi:hypothetical protein
MATEIVDFSDLMDDQEFKIKDDVFVIPCISTEQAMKLMSTGKESFGKKDGEEKEDDDSINDKSFDGLAKYIASIVIVKETGNPIEIPYIKKHWPIKVLHKVVQLINTQFSTASDIDKESEGN